VSSIIQMINSKYFVFQQIADGVFAALHRPGGNAVANSCIIDLGDQTLVFDTTLTPQSGTDLNLAAEALIDRQVTLVVNSHYHIDHTWGNQAFHPESDLISSEGTSRLMARKTLEEYRQLKDETAEKARSIEHLDLQESIRLNTSQPKLSMSYVAGITEALPRLRPRIPNITFDQQMTIHGSRRSLTLYAFTGGHTRSDTVLYLPEESILCTGDLVYASLHPYLLEAELDKLPLVLNELLALDPEILVPGHGPVDSKGALLSMLDYLGTLESIAARQYTSAGTATNLLKTALPAAYDDWELEHHFHPNLYYMYQHVARKASEHEEGDSQDNSIFLERTQLEPTVIPFAATTDSI
jgi:cyclase